MRNAIDSELADSLGQPISPDVPGTILAILVKLDESLAASHKALLALDLDAIEHRTCQQIALVKDLAVSLEAAKSIADAEAPAGRLTQSFRCLARGIREELRDKAIRVRHAARLQLALLARAHRKLRMLANVLAGPKNSYGNFLRMECNVLGRAIELSTANAQGEG